MRGVWKKPLAFALLAAVTLAQGMANAAAPATVKVLELSPESSQATLALPGLDSAVAQIAAFAKHFTDAAEVDKAVSELIGDAAEGAEAWGAKSFKEIGEAHGLHGDAPIGLFVDLNSMVERLNADFKLSQEAAAKKQAEADKAAAEEKPEDGSAPKPAKKVKVQYPRPTVPDLAAVFHVVDQSKAESTLLDLIAGFNEISGLTPKDVTVGSVTIKEYAPYGYFFAGEKLVLGSLGLVKGIAERIDSPAKVAYGTDKCPAGHETEAVLLLQSKSFFPLLAQALPALEIDDAMRPTAEKQVQAMAAVFADNSEPMVVSLGVSGTKGADLQARVDSSANKSLGEYIGEVKPLRLAQFLPENTLAMLTLRFNEQDKKHLKDIILPAVAAQVGPEAASQATMANQIVDSIGDEITLGITGSEQDFPALYLMIGLAKPDETKALLSMLVPAMPGEAHNEVDIAQLAVPSPIQFSIAYPGDMILLSNNIDGMKSIIDLSKGNKTTKFLTSLNPPLDPATPRSSALVLNAKLLTDVLIPITSLGVSLPDYIDGVLKTAGPGLDELRIVNELDGGWRVNKISIEVKQNEKQAAN